MSRFAPLGDCRTENGPKQSQDKNFFLLGCSHSIRLEKLRLPCFFSSKMDHFKPFYVHLKFTPMSVGAVCAAVALAEGPRSPTASHGRSLPSQGWSKLHPTRWLPPRHACKWPAGSHVPLVGTPPIHLQNYVRDSGGCAYPHVFFA